MPVEESLNKILKEMWRIDEKSAAGEALESQEQEFYNQHLQTIKNYYQDHNAYWQKK